MKWKVAFFVQLFLLLGSMIGWTLAVKRGKKCDQVLSKTVELCGEVWIRDPLGDIETAYFISGKQ